LLPRFVGLEVATGVEVLDTAIERFFGRRGRRLFVDRVRGSARQRTAERITWAGVLRAPTHVPVALRFLRFSSIGHRTVSLHRQFGSDEAPCSPADPFPANKCPL